MRGKNRIGWGLALLGLALTAWLGVLALPHLQFPRWEWIPIGIAVAGVASMTWGAVVLGRDALRARQSSQAREDVRAVEREANAARIRADIAIREYWLSVALDYDDHARAHAIRAEILKLNAELARNALD